MQLKDLLVQHYHEQGLPADGGVSQPYAWLYAGPYLMPFPNVSSRKVLVGYHDLHHLFTGYGTSRIGEGEISAWELGSGCWAQPFTILMNLGGMATGLLYSPRRVIRAFYVGSQCSNFYHLSPEALYAMSPQQAKALTHTPKTHRLPTRWRLRAYLGAACMLILPLLILGFCSQPLKRRLL